MPEKRFFEIDEQTSCAHMLAKWQGGTAPCGGPVVWAESERQASELYRAWKYGPGYIGGLRGSTGFSLVLKGDVLVDGHVWHNVIH